MRTRGTILAALILLSMIVLSQSLNPPMISSLESTQLDANSGPFEAEEINWNLVQSVAKETVVFTQGLEIYNGKMYESGGLYGHSSVRSFDIGSGNPIETMNLSSELFGEGLTIFDDEIIVLTWKSGRVLRYSLDFESNDESVIPGEGWGICSFNDMLAISDGSSKITFRDPSNMTELSSINVEFEGNSLDNINELECFENKIYANRWYDSRIFEIDIQSGVVTSYLDLSSLASEYGSSTNGSVLNGIAFEPSSGDLWITGKNWSDFHRITFVTEDHVLTDDFQVTYLIGILVSITILFPLMGSFFFSVRGPKGIQASPSLGRFGGAPYG
jgi:glutamine cyclotransferase